MASPVFLSAHLLERLRIAEAEKLLPALRDSVDLPTANRWLGNAADPGDRRRPAKGLDDVCRFLLLIHAR